MTTQNMTAQQNANEVATHESNGEEKTKRVPVEIKEYASEQEARDNRPAGTDAKNKNGQDAWKVYWVKKPNGTTVYIWGVGAVNAKATVAGFDGYETGLAGSLGRGRSAGENKDAFVGLAKLDDSVLATLGLSEATLAKVKAARTQLGTIVAEQHQQSKSPDAEKPQTPSRRKSK